MINFKKYFITAISLFFLASCVQEAANINYKEENLTSKKTTTNRYSSNLQPSYMRGTYVKMPNNKVVRDLNKNDEDIIIDNSDYEKKSNSSNNSKVKNIKTVEVKSGENLLSIARKYNMTLAEIAELNRIKAPYNIYVKQKIKVYTNENVNMEKSFSNKNGNNYRVVTVKTGDNLTKIAYNNNLTLRELANINNIKPPYKVYVGQKIKVPSKTNSINTRENKDYYVVQKGDNLFGISKKNGIKFTELVKYNNLKKPYSIYVGQKLYLRDNKNNRGIVRKETEYNSTVVENHKTQDSNESINLNESRNINTGDNSFIWPVNGTVIKNFGKQPNGEHSDAINIKAPSGTKILAADDGEVAYAGNDLKSYGNMVIIKHSGGWLSIYGHCDTINVKPKEKVNKGQAIAIVGKTGNVNESQLYFAIRKGKIAVDPLKYLSNN